MTTTTRRAISYTRYSSDRQTLSDSIARQQRAFDKWLLAHPEFVQGDVTFSDLAKSGFHGQHIREGGSFAKLLLAVKAGVIRPNDVIVVEHMDRTGRLPFLRMMNEVIGPILDAGVSIITMDDGAEYTQSSLDGTQIFVLVAKIQAAHGYSKTLSSRVKDSYAERRKKAKEGGGVKRMTPVWLTTEGQVIERIAEHVRMAFELYVSGVGKNTISNRLRATGVPELATCSGPTITGWLSNRSVLGHWQMWTYDGKTRKPSGEEIQNVYPPIIEPDLFYRAQLHAEKMKTVKPTKTAKHLLVGLVKCGHCGGNFVMANKDGKPHNMRCLTRQRFKDAGCDNSKTVPKVVADYVRTSTSFPFVQEAFQRQQLTTNQKRILAIQSEVTGITSKIADLASAIQTVGAIPEILSQLKERQAERDALNDELAVLERTESPVDFLGSYQIEGDLLESDPVKLNALLRGVGYAIVVKADGTLTVGCDVWRLVEYDRMQAAFIVEHDGVQAAVKQDDQMENIRKRVGWTEAFSVSLRRRNETEKK